MRLTTIDTLRGLAIFAMILIHSSAYFLSNKAAFVLWNYSQFAVPIFYFCASYLFFYKDHPPHLSTIYPYFKKRFWRLLKPFYIYVIIYLLLVKVFEPSHITLDFVVRHLTMTTIPSEADWIVILFLQFAIIAPLILFFFTHKRSLFYGYFAISLISSICFMFFIGPHYKFTMWLPWSLILYFALYFLKNEKKKWFYPVTTLCSFSLYITFLLIQKFLGHSLLFFNNKYPPNLYFMLYGIFFITVVFYIVENEVLKIHLLLKPMHFLSIYSYSIFFIHLIVLYVVVQTTHYTNFGWIGLFTIVFTGSVLIQKAILMLTHSKFFQLAK